MKTISTKTLAVAFAGIFLFACDRQEEQELVEPMKASKEADLIGYDPTTCNLVRHFGAGELPRNVNIVEEDGAVMTVTAQRRGHNGKYLQETPAILLDAHDPATDLVNNFDANIMGMSGLLTVSDVSGQKANREGGRLNLDFSPVGSVTMKTMVFTDIAEEDRGSKVELFSAAGQLLDQQEIPPRGKNQTVFVSFDNVPAVTKAIVTFGAERKKVGSGAVSRLQLCVEGQGMRDDVRYYDVHTLWLQYTGDKPANVTVTSSAGEASEVLFSAKGMKPGTMFKLSKASRASLGKALTIETNHKEKQIIPTKADRSASIKKQYGSFKVVEARCTDYPLKLEEL
ncbi:hypothetical protein [Pontibacter litorisediminis]|uniref:hypothetical protein n=1 Tax=Pontibacter litorisediminis TaxID=1846260 RepID=UPI0023ED1776|nr:hypothetical protein [Pontibacter litorisediminis]